MLLRNCLTSPCLGDHNLQDERTTFFRRLLGEIAKTGSPTVIAAECQNFRDQSPLPSIPTKKKVHLLVPEFPFPITPEGSSSPTASSPEFKLDTTVKSASLSSVHTSLRYVPRSVLLKKIGAAGDHPEEPRGDSRNTQDSLLALEEKKSEVEEEKAVLVRHSPLVDLEVMSTTEKVMEWRISPSTVDGDSDEQLDGSKEEASVGRIDWFQKTAPLIRRKREKENLEYRPRKVRIPDSLIESFVQRAADNAREKNTETCGLLYGILDEHGALSITHLLLPEQIGTDCRCEDMDDGEVSAMAINKGLLCIGWIHTRPNQDCFLSNIDVHNHHAYQKMLPEAIGIVVSFQHGEPGARAAFFQLTGRGMEELESCGMSDFHYHKDLSSLYREVPDDRHEIHSDFLVVTRDFRDLTARRPPLERSYL